MNKTIQQLEQELQALKFKEHDKIRREQIKKENEYEEIKKIRIYEAGDYAGMKNGQFDFYFGYEVTYCPYHEPDDEDCDCDEKQWCFQAKNNGDIVMTIPQNELYPKENQSMLFYLLSGIAKFLQ